MRGLHVGPRQVLLVGLILAVACYFLWTWYRPGPVISTADYMTAHAHSSTASLNKVLLPVAAVQILPKAPSVKKLKLPAEVANDPAAQILDAVIVPPTRGGATAVTILDTETGATRTLIKEIPRPFVAFEAGTEVGARYGLSTNGAQQAAIYARRDLLRVGNVYVGLYGEASSRPEARAMIDVSLRW